MGWLLLIVAVAANISSNIMFKLAMAAFPADPSTADLVRFAFNPHLWLGALFCAVLLGCYLLALREIELMVSYAFVISLSLVGLTMLAPLFLGEALSARTVMGMGLVVAGILVITLSRPEAAGDRQAAAAGVEIAHGEH